MLRITLVVKYCFSRKGFPCTVISYFAFGFENTLNQWIMSHLINTYRSFDILTSNAMMWNFDDIVNSQLQNFH